MSRSRDYYERERNRRDARGHLNDRRTLGGREVIDARGSIDSRTFSETHRISSVTADARDRHSAELDTMAENRWHSRAGIGFDDVPDAGGHRRIPVPTAPMRSGSLPGAKANVRRGYSATGASSGLPLFYKITLPLIAVLVIVLLVLLFT